MARAKTGTHGRLGDRAKPAREGISEVANGDYNRKRQFGRIAARSHDSMRFYESLATVDGNWLKYRVVQKSVRCPSISACGEK
jgi:hypothetical protein